MRRHDGVTALDLAGLEAENQHDTRTVLSRFERISPVVCSTRPRRVSVGRVLRGLVASGLRDGPYELPRAAALARVRLLPYQLAPTLAILTGHASRVLIADEVGLGKTIQAAILLRELSDRRLVRRTLIVVPASLREQWQRELAMRVNIQAELCDAAWATRIARMAPPETNPWRLPRTCLVSHDYVKQPEVLSGVAACSWDLVIIDEAHTLTPPTWRAEAGQRLGCAARWLVLLTATPHGGDETAFRALCRTGRLGRDDVLVMFRRTREDVGLPRARVTRLLRVRPSAVEVRLHAALTRYAAEVWAEPSVTAGARLATVVLTKRALSSATALVRSLQRRADLLDAAPAVPDREQLALPLDPDRVTAYPDDEMSDATLMAPGLSDRTRERRWLAMLSTLAIRAQHAERKRTALVRLVRRIREPVVVFTEYRDTLAMLVQALTRLTSRVVTLHGWQTLEERRDALMRFSDGRARILVATDAACEGLNLHARCRFVIIYELPWNPNRLEQRIGRVDRLGQTKRVHVVELVLAGSREDVILARLHARRARIAAALEAPLERAMVIGGHEDIARATDSLPGTATGDERDDPGQPDDRSDVLSRLDLEEPCRDACAELQRLRRLTILWGSTTPTAEDLSRVTAHMQHRGPWTTVIRPRQGRPPSRGFGGTSPSRCFDQTLVLLFVTELQDTSGRSVISIPTVLAAPRSLLGDAASRQWLERLSASPELRARVSEATDATVTAARKADERLLARLRQRDAQIYEELTRLTPAYTPDLFGRRPRPAARHRERASMTSASDDRRFNAHTSLRLAILLPFDSPGGPTSSGLPVDPAANDTAASPRRHEEHEGHEAVQNDLRDLRVTFVPSWFNQRSRSHDVDRQPQLIRILVLDS